MKVLQRTVKTLQNLKWKNNSVIYFGKAYSTFPFIFFTAQRIWYLSKSYLKGKHFKSTYTDKY